MSPVCSSTGAGRRLPSSHVLVGLHLRLVAAEPARLMPIERVAVGVWRTDLEQSVSYAVGEVMPAYAAGGPYAGAYSAVGVDRRFVHRDRHRRTRRRERTRWQRSGPHSRARTHDRRSVQFPGGRDDNPLAGRGAGRGVDRRTRTDADGSQWASWPRTANRELGSLRADRYRSCTTHGRRGRVFRFGPHPPVLVRVTIRYRDGDSSALDGMA